MTAHVHAELMKLYAQDWAETSYPWTRWEFSVGDDVWLDLTTHPDWTADFYRRKPRTHKVNGIEVPEPMREKPAEGAKFWTVELGNSEWCMEWNWLGEQELDVMWLERGLVHATKEAAVANALAMLGRTAP